MLPTWVARSAGAHQVVLAAWQPDPVWVSLVQSLVVAVLDQLPKPRGAGYQDKSKEAVGWVCLAYAIAAFSSAIGHVYVLIRIIMSGDPLVTFSRMYVPHLLTGPAAAGPKLASGPWLFLQYDLMIISLSSLSWAYLLLKNSIGGFQRRGFLELAVVLGTLTIGPGATVSLCLLCREQVLHKQRLSKKERKAVSRAH